MDRGRHKKRTLGSRVTLTLAGLILVLSAVSCQGRFTQDVEGVTTMSFCWMAEGEGTRNRFGYAVGAAGDVDGDGYGDVIVGADQYKAFTGRAYVYAAGPDGLGERPILVATGEAVNNHFGYTVGAAGDVNGDGYGDVIVGAYHYRNFRGRVYVYLGGPDGLGTEPAFLATGEGADTYFGRSVATAGDVNGDGYDDVIVGAQAYDRSTGRAYIYAGSPSGLGASPIWVATGEGPSSSLGQSVGGAGDVDGDGYDDVVVGAQGHDHGTGRAHVYAGGPEGPSIVPAFTITGEGPGHRLGFAVGTAGDVNGDGYDDVVVGAYGFDGDTGRAYVHAGGPDGLNARPILTMTGEAPGSWFGRAVGTAGDVDGDGYDDVVVGAPSLNANAGRIYVYAGRAEGLDVEPLFVADGQAPNGWFGHAVGTAGDVDGDGQSELIVGAYGYGEWAGRVYVSCGQGGGGR